MNKISFPKGSLKFKKLKPTTPVAQLNFKDWFKRKLYAKNMEHLYPHEAKQLLPQDVHQAIVNNQIHLKNFRKELSKIPSNGFNNSYEITFKHPKWSSIIGDITVKSNKQDLKGTLEIVLNEFRYRKQNHRNFRHRQKTTHIKSLITDLTYEISGGVIYMPHIKEGVFLKFVKDQERKIVFSPKIPKESDQKYVGIELEFLCPIDKEALGNKLYDAGLGRYITLVEDHSIKCSHGIYPRDCEEHRDIEFAHELCIIAKENEYNDIVSKACSVLNKEKATVNKSCGMHVHIDCRVRDPEKVYQNLISSQGILLRMNPKSRIEKFAKKNIERDFEYAKTQGGNRGGNIDEGRYYAINAKAYNKHKTIEVRAHAGTVEFKKITNWISILLSIGSSAERYARNFNSINTFCKRYGIKEDMQAYIQERVDKFQIKIEGDTEVVPEAERGVA